MNQSQISKAMDIIASVVGATLRFNTDGSLNAANSKGNSVAVSVPVFEGQANATFSFHAVYATVGDQLSVFFRGPGNVFLIVSQDPASMNVTALLVNTALIPGFSLIKLQSILPGNASLHQVFGYVKPGLLSTLYVREGVWVPLVQA